MILPYNESMMTDPKTQPLPDGENPLIEEIKDSLLMRELMNEMFAEDEVTHEHGGTEPEGD